MGTSAVGETPYRPTIPSLVPVKAYQTAATALPQPLVASCHCEDKGLTPSCCRAMHAACWSLESLSFKALV